MRKCFVVAAVCVTSIAAGACVFGSRDPGCASDADCDQGFVCREGACFEITTPRSPPNDPRDAGDGG